MRAGYQGQRICGFTWGPVKLLTTILFVLCVSERLIVLRGGRRLRESRGIVWQVQKLSDGFYAFIVVVSVGFVSRVGEENQCV